MRVASRTTSVQRKRRAHQGNHELVVQAVRDDDRRHRAAVRRLQAREPDRPARGHDADRPAARVEEGGGPFRCGLVPRVARGLVARRHREGLDEIPAARGGALGGRRVAGGERRGSRRRVTPGAANARRSQPPSTSTSPSGKLAQAREHRLHRIRARPVRAGRPHPLRPRGRSPTGPSVVVQPVVSMSSSLATESPAGGGAEVAIQAPSGTTMRVTGWGSAPSSCSSGSLGAEVSASGDVLALRSRGRATSAPCACRPARADPRIATRCEPDLHDAIQQARSGGRFDFRSNIPSVPCVGPRSDVGGGDRI